jgi:cytochrome P450
MIRNPLRYFAHLADTQGPRAHLQLGDRHFYLLNDPELIRDLLITQGALFEKFPRIERTKGLFGEGLLTSEDPVHLRQRRLMQPAFQRERIAEYGRMMTRCTQALMANWRDGQEIEATAAMSELTLEIVARSLFTTEAGDKATTIAHELEVVLKMLNQLVMPWGPLLLGLPLPASLRYRAALRQLDAIVYGIIDERLACGREHDDLLGMLLSVRDADTGERMDRLQIRDEVMTIFVAGHETAANALAWTLYLLSENPEARQQLEAELDAVLGARPPGPEDYPQLPFCQRVFQEAMRLYPPVWILGRRALAPYTFQDFTATKGSVLLVSMAVLHRRAEFFPEPDHFLPDRWLQSTAPKFAYLPFGGGARLCIGERYAWMEGVLCLANLAQRFRLDLLPGNQVEPLGLLTLRPKHGLRMRVSARVEQR